MRVNLTMETWIDNSSQNNSNDQLQIRTRKETKTIYTHRFESILTEHLTLKARNGKMNFQKLINSNNIVLSDLSIIIHAKTNTTIYQHNMIAPSMIKHPYLNRKKMDKTRSITFLLAANGGQPTGHDCFITMR